MRYLTILSLALFISCQTKTSSESSEAVIDSLRFEEEVHLKSVRQLTWGGNNAEAYWSFNGKSLVFQSDFAEWGVECDQIFTMNVEDSSKDQKPPMVSTGLGRTTCSYFLPEIH